MRWRKQPKKQPLDFAAMQNFVGERQRLDLAKIPASGPAKRLALDFQLHRQSLDFEDAWNSLSPLQCWRILQTTRMARLFGGETPCEFARYLELKHRSGPSFEREIFVGINPDTNHPIFVPSRVFCHHAYILGMPGAGKTSQALAQVLIQLSLPQVWSNEKGAVRAPILIIDMKESGDGYLRALAERLAKDRDQELRFFSLDPDYQSLLYDPLYSLRTIEYPLKLVETLLKALSLVYPEGYGSDFFTNEQRKQLMDIVYKQRPRSLFELIAMVSEATRGQSGNRDARGLDGALAALQYVVNLCTRGEAVDDDKLVDFHRFYENREVMYAHLDSRSLGLVSRDIGKLFLFSLLETASFRKKHGCRRQMFVAIDEFQRLAARNIVETLEDSRLAGVGFIFCHQSPKSIQTRDADLYGMISSLCSFQQFLTIDDDRMIEALRPISGRVSEWSENSGESEAHGTTQSSSMSFSTSSSTMNQTTRDPRGLFPIDITSTGSSSGSGSSSSSGAGRSDSRGTYHGRSEQKIPGLTPEMITRVNDTNLLSLMMVRGVGRDCLTPTGGIPTLVQGMYPYTAADAAVMESTPWPMRPPRDPEEYYAPARPVIPPKAIEALSGTTRPEPKPPKQKPSTGTPPARRFKPVNEIEQRELRRKIRDFVKRFEKEMISEPITVERFARDHRMRLDKVFQLASQIGLKLSGRDAHLSANQVRALERASDQKGRPPA